MREFILSSAGAAGTAGTTILGATTLNAIKPAAAPSVNIRFIRHWTGQAANATSAMQRVAFHQQAVAGSPVVVSATPSKTKLQDPNASAIVGGTAIAAGTCGIAATTESTGATTLIWEDTFNVVNGYFRPALLPEVEEFPAGLVNFARLWFPTAPGTLTGWTWGQTFAEV